jgi:hypothetical protein
MNINPQDLREEAKRMERRLSTMILSDEDREKSELYLLELYAQINLLRPATAQRFGTILKEPRSVVQRD